MHTTLETHTENSAATSTPVNLKNIKAHLLGYKLINLLSGILRDTKHVDSPEEVIEDPSLWETFSAEELLDTLNEKATDYSYIKDDPANSRNSFYLVPMFNDTATTNLSLGILGYYTPDVLTKFLCVTTDEEAIDFANKLVDTFVLLSTWGELCTAISYAQSPDTHWPLMSYAFNILKKEHDTCYKTCYTHIVKRLACVATVLANSAHTLDCREVAIRTTTYTAVGTICGRILNRTLPPANGIQHAKLTNTITSISRKKRNNPVYPANSRLPRGSTIANFRNATTKANPKVLANTPIIGAASISKQINNYNSTYRFVFSKNADSLLHDESLLLKVDSNVELDVAHSLAVELEDLCSSGASEEVVTAYLSARFGIIRSSTIKYAVIGLLSSTHDTRYRILNILGYMKKQRRYTSNLLAFGSSPVLPLAVIRDVDQSWVKTVKKLTDAMSFSMLNAPDAVCTDKKYTGLGMDVALLHQRQLRWHKLLSNSLMNNPMFVALEDAIPYSGIISTSLSIRSKILSLISETKWYVPVVDTKATIIQRKLINPDLVALVSFVQTLEKEARAHEALTYDTSLQSNYALHETNSHNYYANLVKESPNSKSIFTAIKLNPYMSPVSTILAGLETEQELSISGGRAHAYTMQSFIDQFPLVFSRAEVDLAKQKINNPSRKKLAYILDVIPKNSVLDIIIAAELRQSKLEEKSATLAEQIENSRKLFSTEFCALPEFEEISLIKLINAIELQSHLLAGKHTVNTLEFSMFFERVNAAANFLQAWVMHTPNSFLSSTSKDTVSCIATKTVPAVKYNDYEVKYRAVNWELFKQSNAAKLPLDIQAIPSPVFGFLANHATYAEPARDLTKASDFMTLPGGVSEEQAKFFYTAFNVSRTVKVAPGLYNCYSDLKKVHSEEVLERFASKFETEFTLELEKNITSNVTSSSRNRPLMFGYDVYMHNKIQKQVAKAFPSFGIAIGFNDVVPFKRYANKPGALMHSYDFAKRKIMHESEASALLRKKVASSATSVDKKNTPALLTKTASSIQSRYTNYEHNVVEFITTEVEEYIKSNNDLIRALRSKAFTYNGDTDTHYMSRKALLVSHIMTATYALLHVVQPETFGKKVDMAVNKAFEICPTEQHISSYLKKADLSESISAKFSLAQRFHAISNMYYKRLDGITVSSPLVRECIIMAMSILASTPTHKYSFMFEALSDIPNKAVDKYFTQRRTLSPSESVESRQERLRERLDNIKSRVSTHSYKADKQIPALQEDFAIDTIRLREKEIRDQVAEGAYTNDNSMRAIKLQKQRGRPSASEKRAQEDFVTFKAEYKLRIAAAQASNASSMLNNIERSIGDELTSVASYNALKAVEASESAQAAKDAEIAEKLSYFAPRKQVEDLNMTLKGSQIVTKDDFAIEIPEVKAEPDADYMLRESHAENYITAMLAMYSPDGAPVSCENLEACIAGAQNDPYDTYVISALAISKIRSIFAIKARAGAVLN